MSDSSKDLPFNNSPYVILIDKPVGITSYDVIRSLKPAIFETLGKGKGRRKLKIGHFGTLDPFAGGLLLVGTGKALKLVQYFQNKMTKTYRGLGTFEFSTDTGDKDGKIIEETTTTKKSESISIADLGNEAQKFIGPYHQKPPYFSAVKHDGRPLYEWAREGVFIDKPAVERQIFDFKILDNPGPKNFSFEARVSSGTYIRGLWFDLAKSLGLPGHLLTLNRCAWGEISLEDHKDRSVSDFPVKKLTSEHFILVNELWDLPKIMLDQQQAELFCRGVYLTLSGSELKEYQWVMGPNNELLGLGVPVKANGQELLKVEVNLT